MGQRILGEKVSLWVIYITFTVDLTEQFDHYQLKTSKHFPASLSYDLLGDLCVK